MKLQEIYENTLALTLETPADNPDFGQFVVGYFNILLRELFCHNNIARKRNGKPPLAVVPVVSDKHDENPYEWQFDNALIYGLAAKLLTADEHGLEGTYLQLYYAAVNGALQAQQEEVEDCYVHNCTC